jgi:uncharacterized protein (TIGR02147 family)
MDEPYPSVYAYSDFRRFLAAYFEARSRREKRFTQTFICRKLGLPNSRSFFGDVIRGQKPLTAPKTGSLIELLGLKGNEAKYFRTLVLYNQSSISCEKEYFLEQLLALNPSPAITVERDAFEYYKTWYHSVVRALLDVLKIGSDLDPLKGAIYPTLSRKQLRQSFVLLKKLGLIHKDPDGFWKPSAKVIHSGSYLQDEIVKQYQVQCLEIAKSAILSRDKNILNISTETLSISKKGYLAIEARLQKFKNEIRAIARHDAVPADRVYQLNIQLFPQSRLAET